MILAYLLMISLVASSNILVQFPLNDWLTLAAFTYPITFLVTELTNRHYGPSQAKKVVYIGFLIATLLSWLLATPRIAIASGSAFLTAQLLDILVFNRLRNQAWWYAPLFASFLASGIDTLIFWNIAFWQEEVPLLTWALGDFAVKIAIDLVMLLPFRLFLTSNSAIRNIITPN